MVIKKRTQKVSTTQKLISRNLSLFKDKNVLVAGAIPDLNFLEINKSINGLEVFTTNFYICKQLSGQSIKVTFDYVYKKAPSSKIDLIIFYWPKSKKEAEYLMATILNKFSQNVEIFFIGENNSGINSLKKGRDYLSNIRKIDNANRCSLYYSTSVSTLKYRQFNINNWFESFSFEEQNAKLKLKSLPGVFSHGKIDIGTNILLKYLSTVPLTATNILDVGCGCGIISLFLKSLYPKAKITAVDISALALKSTEETFRINNFTGEFLPSDVYSEVFENQYDLIVSNPPFHNGLNTFYESAESLIIEAKEKLKTNAQLLIVANSFLPYLELLNNYFENNSKVVEEKGFSIFKAY